jgi:hypothetical protein
MEAKVRNVSNGVIDLNLPDREVKILPFKEANLTSKEMEVPIVQRHIKNKDLIVRL